MNTCKDCGKEISKEAERCRTCFGINHSKNFSGENHPGYKDGRTLGRTCPDCGKPVGPQALRCYPCSRKYISENKLNPGNYKDGSYMITPKCVDCGKELVKKTAKRCKECYTKVLIKRVTENPINPKESKTSLETRKKQSIAKLTYFNTLGEERKNPYVFDWNLIRKDIYKRDNYNCQECGVKCTGDIQGNTKIQCHHIDYNKNNNKSENLITLCIACHQQTNFNREKWIEYYQNKMNKSRS